jgi:DNA-binding response OmpR family regulator
MRILIADDDAMSRVLLETWLVDWGYGVVAVDDGAAAWQALAQEDAPPIAILDWMMPTMTGPEVCRALRAEAPTRPSYVILVTARNRPEDIIAGLEAGADDYLCKGFNPQELRAHPGGRARAEAAIRSGDARRGARGGAGTSAAARRADPDLRVLQEGSRRSRLLAAGRGLYHAALTGAV